MDNHWQLGPALLHWLPRVHLALLTVSALTVYVVPALRLQLLPYGKLMAIGERAVSAQTRPRQQLQQRPSPMWTWLWTVHVPKCYFVHFYVLGYVWSALVLGACVASSLHVVGGWHVPLASPWGAPLALHLQMARRLWESVFVTRHSTQARMLLGHYLVGMSFYVSAGLLAGMRSVRSSGTVAACAWIVFAAASMGQFQCHRQLAALRPTSTADTRQAYVRPHGSWFRWSYTPHYQLEMVIYAAMWALAGPGGLHGTCVGQDNGMSWCLLWVVVNLGILSAENRRWYAATAHVGDFGKAQ